MKKSLFNLLNILSKKKIDAFLVTDENNIRYLTDFRGHDSMLVISPKGNFAVTDFRYSEEVEAIDALKSNFEIVLKKKNFSESLKTIQKKIKFKNLAFEESNLKYQRYAVLKNALNCNLIPQRSLVESLRRIKTDEEIALIRKAIEISKIAFQGFRKDIKVGASESMLSAKLDYLMRLNGACGSAFETIVAVDANSSMPHAEITETRVQKNSKIMIDFGARFKGYNSDLTREVFLGKIDPAFKKIYSVVEAAQKIAIENIKAGVPIKKIDALSRNYIKNKGFGKFFGHALGHGVGLSVHEDPSISPYNKDYLEERMVFTVEPGIYIPGVGGVRLEEMVLVTGKGCEVLSK